MLAKNNHFKLKRRSIIALFLFSYFIFSFYSFTELEGEIDKMTLFTSLPQKNQFKIKEELLLEHRRIVVINLSKNLNIKVKRLSINLPNHSLSSRPSPHSPIHFIGAIEENRENQYTYSPDNFVLLTYSPKVGSLMGEIRVDGKSYFVKSLDDKKSTVQIFPEKEAEKPRMEFKENRDISLSTVDYLTKQSSTSSIDITEEKREKSLSQSPYVVDMMVLYTPSAKTRQRRISHKSSIRQSPDIEEEIIHEVAMTNHYFAQSGIKTRLRLVHLAPFNFKGTGIGSQDLRTITKGEPGNHKEIVNQLQNLRAKYGADLVSLWVGNLDLCGIAWAQTIPDDRNFGISLKKVGCGASTFAHEVGHNFGLAHDRFSEKEGENDLAADFGKAYGHVDLVEEFRTIMSYDDKCRYYGVDCERVNLYSTPYQNFRDRPLGVIGIADAVTTVNNNTPIISSYYQAKSPLTKSLEKFDSLNGPTNAIGMKSDPLTKACFIATYAYQGDSYHPHLNKLRNFRDKTLTKLPMGIGSFLIQSYYFLAPQLIKILPSHQAFKKLFKFLLSPIILILSKPIFLLIFTSLFLGILFLLSSPKKFIKLLIIFYSPVIFSKGPPTLMAPFSKPFLSTEMLSPISFSQQERFLGLGIQKGERISHLRNFEIERSKQDYKLPLVFIKNNQQKQRFFRINIDLISYEESENNENQIPIKQRKNSFSLSLNYAQKMKGITAWGFSYNLHLAKEIRENEYKRKEQDKDQRHEEDIIKQQITPAISLHLGHFSLMLGPSLNYFYSPIRSSHAYLSEKAAIGYSQSFNKERAILSLLLGIEHVPDHLKVSDKDKINHQVYEETPITAKFNIAFNPLSISLKTKRGKVKDPDKSKVVTNTYAITYSKAQEEIPIHIRTELKETRTKGKFIEKRYSVFALYIGKYY